MIANGLQWINACNATAIADYECTFSHRSEPIRQRCRSAGHVGQPLDHATELESTVEAISEGAEVAPKVFFSDGVVGTMKSVLDVPQNPVDRGEPWGYAPRLVLSLMRIDIIL